MSLPALTLIPAGAGSGKTHTIQTRLAEWVSKDLVRPDRIVAVTFTEAAANELRERIRLALLSDPKITIEQTLALDQAYISTIHGFGLRLIQEYCFEGGWSPTPRLLTEDEGDILIRQALAATDKADPVMDDLSAFGYRYDGGKNITAEEQLRGRVGAMIKKLRIIGREDNCPEIHRGLCESIRKRYGVPANAADLENALKRAGRALLDAFPESLADRFPGNQSYVKAMTRDYRNYRRAVDTDALQHDWALWKALQDLRLSNSRYALPDGYDALAQTIMDAARNLYRHPGPLEQALTHADALIGAAWDSLVHHTQLKRERGLVDYGDMLSLANGLLTTRPDVFEDFSEHVDCVVIDEFQDTNPLQFSLLWSLHRNNVPALVVGDVKQAIMGFQDADPRLLAAMEERYPHHCEPLKANWRTTETLMNFLNEIGAGLFGDGYQKLAPRAVFQCTQTPLRIIQFTRYSQSHAFYAQHTAAQICEILADGNSQAWDKHSKKFRPLKGADIAVLLPSNSLVQKYADALRQLGLQVRVSARGWFESRSVQLAYHALFHVADPSDRHAALYLAVTELGRGDLEDSVKSLINDQSLDDPVLKTLDSVVDGRPDRDVQTVVAETLETLDLFGIISEWPDAAQERASLLRLLAEAKVFCETNPETLEAGGFHGFELKTFLAWLDVRKDENNDKPEPTVINEDAIELSTWHSAKGREWPVVAVCGTYKTFDAWLPSLDTEYLDFSDLDRILENARIAFSPKFAADETNQVFLEPLEQEAEVNAKRLLYVALTRAREQLIIERPTFYEGTDKNSYWNLLRRCVDLAFDENTVESGRKSFPCRQVTIAKENAEGFDQEPTEQNMPLPCLGRRAVCRQPLSDNLTPESLSPSQLRNGASSEHDNIQTHHYGKPLAIDLDRSATETGIILHRCFEILAIKQDRTHLLETGTGYSFTPEQKQMLQTAVTHFEQWLIDHLGAVKIRKEVPLTYLNAAGSVINGTIDVLVETDAGYWVLDHKTHHPENPDEDMTAYWPQLTAYREGVKKLESGKDVLGVGVNWVMVGAVTVRTPKRIREVWVSGRDRIS